MQFKSERALNFLLTNGGVVTMRNYDYKVGRKVKINRKYNGWIIGKILNSRAIREECYDLSGFDTIEEWEQEAIKLHGKLPKYIYIVVTDEEFRRSFGDLL